MFLLLVLSAMNRQETELMDRDSDTQTVSYYRYLRQGHPTVLKHPC